MTDQGGRTTDEQLRAAYGRVMQAQRATPRTGCPDPDALIALVQRNGPEAARLETLDHVMSCSACRADFELLRAIDVGEHRESNARAGARSTRWQRPLALALAASLALAVGLGPGIDWWRERDATVMRGDADAIVMLRPEADAIVSRDSLALAWRSVPGATRYTVELLTADGAVGLTETTADTILELPAARGIAPGEYRWWVRAELPGGERRSALRRVRLRD